MSERRIFHLITRPIMTGILALLPIGLTVAIVAWLVDFMAKLLGPGSSVGAMLKRVGWNFGESDFGAYPGGMLFVLLLTYLPGLLVEIGLKSRWERFTDGLSSRIPVIRRVYDASKKIVQMLEPKKSADMQSMKPIICNFGGESGTGFPAFLPTTESFLFNGEEYHVVMIPTAPDTASEITIDQFPSQPSTADPARGSRPIHTTLRTCASPHRGTPGHQLWHRTYYKTCFSPCSIKSINSRTLTC